MENKIEVQFGVKLDELFSGLNGAKSAVTAATDQMKTGVAGLGEAFSKMQGLLMGATAVFAGGKLFGDAVNETKQFTGEAVRLSKALGITVDEASTLNVALGDIYADAGQFIGAAQMMGKTMRTNEAGMKALGVETRNTDGTFRNQRDTMMDALGVINQYTEGIDRQNVARQLFGRGWADAMSLLKLNNDVLDEAKKKQEDLGLTVSQDNVNALKAYKAAMNDAGDVTLGVKKVVGDELMPILTDMAVMFAETGPGRVKVMRVVMQGLGDVFRVVIDAVVTLKSVVGSVFSTIGDIISGGAGKGITAMQFLENVVSVVKIAVLGFELGVVIAFEVIGVACAGLVSNFKTLARMAIAAFALDWGGVKAAWSDGTKEVEKIASESADRILAKAGLVSEQMQNAAMGKPINGVKAPAAAAPLKVGKSSSDLPDGKDDKEPKDSGMLAYWDKQLATARMGYQLLNGLKEMSFASDVTFWTKALELSKQNMKEDLAAAGDDAVKRTAITNKAVMEQMSITEKVSQARLALMKKEVAEGRGMSEQVVSEAEKKALSAIDMTKQGYDSDVALGRINAAQMIAIEINLEQQRVEVQRMAQSARAALVEQDPNRTPAALQREKDKMLEIERAHELKLSGLKLALMKKEIAEGRAMSEQVVNEAEKKALSGIDLAKQSYDTDVALRRISAAQLIDLELGLERQRIDIQRMAQTARIALVEQDPSHSPAALQSEKDKLLEIERAHELKLSGLKQKGVLEQAQVGLQMRGSMESSFAGIIKTFASGTMTIRSLFRNIGKAILDSMIDVFAKIAAKWAATQIANLVMSKITAAETITAEAAKAGAGGVASMAAAPFPLNLTAPAFGFGMSALAASFGIVASAAGGFDIPAGMNPVTQLHQREMVLPAEHADTIRGLSAGGGGGGDINITISGQQLAGGFFMAHQSELAAALKKARRNGHFS